MLELYLYQLYTSTSSHVLKLYLYQLYTSASSQVLELNVRLVLDPRFANSGSVNSTFE